MLLQGQTPAAVANATVAGERGGKRSVGNKSARGRGGRGRGRGGGGGPEGADHGSMVKLSIRVSAEGSANVEIQVLARKWRTQKEHLRDDKKEQQKEKEDKRAESKKEKETRKNDAAYTQARGAVMGLLDTADGSMNLNAAMALADKFLAHAQRCIDARAQEMQLSLRSEEDGEVEAEAEVEVAAAGVDVDAKMLAAVKLCAECVDINKHVRKVLAGILGRREADDMSTKNQEKMLELLTLSQEWSNAFDASAQPLPSWLHDETSDKLIGLKASVGHVLVKITVSPDVKARCV